MSSVNSLIRSPMLSVTFDALNSQSSLLFSLRGTFCSRYLSGFLPVNTEHSMPLSQGSIPCLPYLKMHHLLPLELAIFPDLFFSIILISVFHIYINTMRHEVFSVVSPAVSTAPRIVSDTLLTL